MRRLMTQSLRHLIVLLALLAVSGLGATALAADTLNGAGATFPYPVYSAWAYEYNKITGTAVNYQSIGSGGGQRQITERTVDFGASDEPLPPEKLDKDGLFQFPAVIGGVVPVVNIPGVADNQLSLDSQALCRIMLGEITKWSDPAVTALNPGMKLPDGAITVVHRSDGSGTTAIFTDYLADVCPSWKTKVGAGKAVNWPVGIGGKGNEGVANYVKKTPNSIGYVEFAYAKQNGLAAARLKNAAGKIVAPSMESFKAAAASADFSADKHFFVWLNNVPGEKSWPIAGATFILLARDKADSNKKAVQFFDWALKNGDPAAEKLVYVPLPEELKNKVRNYWKKNGL